jgi:hypothetical protein
VRFLVHNSAPVDCSVSRELQALANENANVAFIEKSGDQLYWQGLLDRSDLIVLPYEPDRYRQSGSGVATEAISDGIPIVVPPGSSMETLANTYQGGATAFSTWDADAVTSAIERAVANFEVLAKQSEAGAIEWRHNNGVRLFMDRFLEIATFEGRPPPAKPHARSARDALMEKVLNRLVFGRAGPVSRQT